VKQSKHADVHPLEELSKAYDRILDLSKRALDEVKEESGPLVEKVLQRARENAVELGELTREQAEKASDYIVRDLHDAAEFVGKQKREMSEWLGFEGSHVESETLKRFSSMVDQAKHELGHLARSATGFGEWRTGEITGVGTLKCKKCEHKLHFHKTGHIPPCPTCQGTTFVRARD
jgi:polyhydroxyalkanoate synthesis regulator phasin